MGGGEKSLGRRHSERSHATQGIVERRRNSKWGGGAISAMTSLLVDRGARNRVSYEGILRWNFPGEKTERKEENAHEVLCGEENQNLWTQPRTVRKEKEHSRGRD